MSNEKKQRNWTKLGLIPVVAFSLSIMFLFVFDIRGPVFDPPYMQFILQAILVFGSSIAIAIISAKAYLGSRSLNVLLLGNSVLISGLASTIASWAVSLSSNEAATIGDVGILFSSFFILLSAIITLAGTESNGNVNRKAVLVAVYLTSLFSVGVIGVLAGFDLMPVFLTPAGPTLIRLVVLAVSIVLYFASCLMFGWRYLQVKSHVLYWYSSALGLFALALVAAAFTMRLGDVTNWVSRLALYLSSVYFLIALLSRQTKVEATVGLSEKWAEAFRVDRKHLYDLFANMLDGFTYNRIIIDKDRKPVDYVFLEVNNAFEKMTGLSKSQVVGKRVTDVISGAEKEDWIGIYGQVAIAGESLVFESYSKQLNKWFNISTYSPEKGYFVALFEDITKRKKAEEALRKQSEERYRQLFESINEFFSLLEPIFDSNNRVVDILYLDVNPATEKEVGLKKEQMVGKTAKELFMPPEPYWLEFYGKVAKTGKSARDTLYSAQTGKHYEIYAWSPTKGQVAQIASDITERKNLEKIVEERTKQLKDSERLAAIGATAGMVGHDIRNPLQAITSDVYLAKTELASTLESEEKKNALESLEEIEKNVGYIDKIVADLQDYARSIKPAVKETDLEAVIGNLLLNSGVPKNIAVSSIVENDSKKIVSDPDLLKRILGNLVTNAAQAMPEGGKLSVHAYRDGSEYVIAVKDTGVGIPKEAKDKLFTPLFTTKSKGQGFGLAVVKRLTEALGGTVTFESQQGKGTTFIVRFPPQK